MSTLNPRRIVTVLAAPLLAMAFAVLLSSLILMIAGHSPWLAFKSMASFGSQENNLVSIVNKATSYYLAALAVAIGFRMNLFNIGVDGQYRLAAMCAAAVGAAVSLPRPLHLALIIGIAMVVGALWAGIAAALKVYRGVSEVISTIMLNFVAGSIVAWMLSPGVFGDVAGNNVGTKPIPESGWMPGIPVGSSEIYGFVVVSVLVGIVYWFILNRTRFGFDLRATGMSEPAAVASGVDVRRMVMASMLLSGAVAGLVGLPILLGDSHNYDLSFPAGIGFTGIAIALLGRNNAVGMAAAALLWGFLDVSKLILDLESIPTEIVTIMQGITVLAVVIAYEVIGRAQRSAEQRAVARQLAGPNDAQSVSAEVAR